MFKIVISVSILVMVSNCGNSAITQDKQETLENKKTLVMSPNEQEEHREQSPMLQKTVTPKHSHDEMHKQGIIHLHIEGK